MTFATKTKTRYGKVSELAKLYAEGQKFGSARDGRVFIEGDKIYSYGKHWVIAEKLSDNAYKVNTSNYSPTTTKQTNEVEKELKNKGFNIVEEKMNG